MHNFFLSVFVGIPTVDRGKILLNMLANLRKEIELIVFFELIQSRSMYDQGVLVGARRRSVFAMLFSR